MANILQTSWKWMAWYPMELFSNVTTSIKGNAHDGEMHSFWDYRPLSTLKFEPFRLVEI